MSKTMFHAVIDSTTDLILAATEKGLLNAEGSDALRRSGEGDKVNDSGVLEAADNVVLGDYQAMASPGVIRLYWRPIGTLFCGAWNTLKALDLTEHRPQGMHADVCRLMVGFTYFHEQFHFLWDWAVKRDLAGNFAPNMLPRKDPVKEEALATAWSWYCSQAYGKELRLPAHIIECVTRYKFDDIDLRGYKDWKEWAHGCFFESEFANYFGAVYMKSADPDPRDRFAEFLKRATANAHSAHYEVYEIRGSSHDFHKRGSRSAFPPFVSGALIHSATTYYPKSCCDLGMVADLTTGSDIAYHLSKHPEAREAQDVFMCHNMSLSSLCGLHQFTPRSWGRVCLRHNPHVRDINFLAHMPKATIPLAYVDDPSLQNVLVDIWNSNQELNPLTLAKAIIEEDLAP